MNIHCYLSPQMRRRKKTIRFQLMTSVTIGREKFYLMLFFWVGYINTVSSCSFHRGFLCERASARERERARERYELSLMSVVFFSQTLLVSSRRTSLLKLENITSIPISLR